MLIKPNKNLQQLVLLYVEDDRFIKEAFYMILKKYFKKVYVASNGAEALEIFNSNNDIDLIISDIKMPVLNGFEMAKEIRKKDFEIPIVLTTGFDSNEYLKQAIDIGINGYINKPIDRNQVFEKLNSIADAIIAKKEVYEYLNLIKTLFDYQKEAIVLLDKDLNIKTSNYAFKQLLKELNIFEDINFYNIISNFEKENSKEINKDEFYDNDSFVIVYKSNEMIKYFKLDIKNIDNYILITFHDITEYKIFSESMKELALKDELTGFYNRKVLKELKLDNNYVCLIIFDIDDFKRINDTYGHLKGDEVIRALAKEVKHNLRESDLVIRWGGEEFLVVLKGAKDIAIATKLAQKLREKIAQLKIDNIDSISCSFGVSCGFVSNDESIDNLLDIADERLYKAKKNGKNRVEYK